MVLVETKRLIIREARYEDIDKVIELETNEENRPYLWVDDYDGHKGYIDSEENILFIIDDKQTKDVLGYGLVQLDFKSEVFQLRRIAISKKGMGYGKEVMLGIFEYAFKIMNMNRLWLDVYPFHQVGINLYETLGMNMDGVLRENCKDERGYLDQMVYSMLKDEYLEIYG